MVIIDRQFNAMHICLWQMMFNIVYITKSHVKIIVNVAFRRPNLQPINVPQLTTESLNNPIKFDDYKKQELIKEEEERLHSFKVMLNVHFLNVIFLVLHYFCMRLIWVGSTLTLSMFML